MSLDDNICLSGIYAVRIIGYLIIILKILVPIALIIVSTKHLFGAVVKGESKELSGAFSKILKSIFAGIIIFMLPTLINSLVELLTKRDLTSSFYVCKECMNEPNGNLCKDYLFAYEALMDGEEIHLGEDYLVDGSVELAIEEVFFENTSSDGCATTDCSEGEVELPTESGEISGDLEIHFINPSSRVDAIYIKVGDKSIFVDGGFKADGKKEAAYLDKIGVKKIDYYIGSHSHKNHVEAAPHIISKYGIKNVLVGREKCNNSGSSPCSWYTIKFFASEQNINLNGVSMKALQPGDTFSLNGLKITCIGPMVVNNGLNRGDTAQNYNSLVLRLEYGSKSFLLTGDNSSGSTATKINKAYPGKLNVDVLKNPHHNSNFSSSYQLVTPEYVVFTTAKGYMPSSSCINDIKKAGAKNYYIVADGKSGNVVFSSDGQTINVKSNYNP